MLVKPLGKDNGLAAVELETSGNDSFYLVQTGWIIRDKNLKKKKLLFSRSESLDTSPVTDEVSQTDSDKTGETDSNALLKSNSSSLPSQLDKVNEANNDFISDELVERLNQRAFHGTGYVMEDNEFKLDKIGSGEGHQAFGYGAYLAETTAVPQHYRHYGLPDNDNTKYPVTIYTENGKKFSFNKESQLPLDNISRAL